MSFITDLLAFSQGEKHRINDLSCTLAQRRGYACGLFRIAEKQPLFQSRPSDRLVSALVPHQLTRFPALFFLLVFLAGCSLFLPASPPIASPQTEFLLPIISSTPSYQPFEPLLAKWAAVGPVYVTGDQPVPDVALKLAGVLLDEMLQHRPDIGARLRLHGAFTVVASHDQDICDLPYFSHDSAYYCDLFGKGGAGGTSWRPITACDERNLLKEPDDPYQRGASQIGQNICVHELAHTIMNVGLTQEDRNRIHARYVVALNEERWKGDFALTNDQEFWAVMSQFYFWAGPSMPYAPSFNHVANGSQALKQYDPVTFALLDSIYQGSMDLQ